MAAGDRGIALRELNALFSEGVIGGLTDAQLLERFTSRRDETGELAFRALVERHGPMVLRVCRSVLRDTADADDAFQATFLVLARRAGSLWVRDSLGPWLHSVAVRTAACARTAAARRTRHELCAARMNARPPDDGDRDDLEAVVHEELGHLPQRYREAVVLCLLEGLTPDQAARHLNCPAGTVHSRLARGRERLRRRLTRRGLTVPAGLLTVGSASNVASAAVPPALAESTIRPALRLAVGPVSAGAVPASVAALTAMILRTTLMAEIRVTMATLLLVGVLAAGAGVLARQGVTARKPQEASQARGTGPVAKPFAVDSLGDPLPTGARLRLGTLRFRPPSIVVDLALSPDQATIVTVGDELIVWDAATGKEVWRADPREYGRHLPAAAYGQRAIAFSADSSRFYTPGRVHVLNEISVWQTASGRHEVLTIAKPNQIGDMEAATRSVDVTPDGRKLAVGSGRGLVVCDLHGKVLYEIANTHGPFKIDHRDRLASSGHYSLGRFSPDGTILAVITSDRPEEIRLYEAESGHEIRKFALASRLVRLAFSPDGKHLATTERDSAVRLYDVDTGNRAWSHIVKLTNIYENYTSALAFSSDGKVLAACATDHRIYLMNPLTGDEIGQLAGHHWYPWALAFTANSKMLYSSGWDPAIRRWDVATRQQLALPMGTRATGLVAASPDGQTLAYEDDLGAIRLVSADHGTERRTFALSGTEYSQLVFSPDGRRLAAGGTSGDRVHVAVWDVPGGDLVHRWDWPKGRDPHSAVESLCFTPDGARLAAAVFRQSAAYVWNLAIGQQTAQLKHNQVYDLSFSPDGRTLATAGWDSIVRFWETETGKLDHEVKIAERAMDDNLQRLAPAFPQARPVKVAGGNGEDLRMYSVCVAAEGGLIATAHLDGAVRIWQAGEMLLRTRFQVNGRFIFGAMSFSPDGLWLATGAQDGTIEVWDPLTAKIVWNSGRHQSGVYTVDFGRDARTLVSGGQDGLCYLWDLRPAANQPDHDPARLWDELAGEDGRAAYQAMWALSETPDRAVAILGEKLRPVTTVIDLDRVDAGKPHDEIHRLRRMKKLLVNKDPKVESALTARRAIALLAQIGTPDAIGLLNDLAARHAKKDLGRLAIAALNRLRIPKKP